MVSTGIRILLCYVAFRRVAPRGTGIHACNLSIVCQDGEISGAATTLVNHRIDKPGGASYLTGNSYFGGFMIDVTENARKELEAYFADKERGTIRVYLTPGG